ncbi:hypothetical protein Tco_1523661 [Tanacetum coccineum]
MTSLWEVLKTKKLTMPIKVTKEEDIEETTTVGVLGIGEIENQEMKTKIPILERTSLPFHQHPKQRLTSPILKKPCENSCPTNDKPYRPLSARNKHVNAIFTRSGLTYDSPVNPNAKITVIYDDSEDEVDEVEKEVESSSSKQAKKVRINVLLVDVLAGMPNYGKFLKDLVSNKSKMEQISTAFLNEECSAIVQNKLPPKLGDPGSFMILCIIAGLV